MFFNGFETIGPSTLNVFEGPTIALWGRCNGKMVLGFFLFLGGIMTISRQNVTFAFWFIEFCWNPFSKTCPRWKNPVKIFVNLYFSDFEPFFLLFGGVCAKCPFYKTKSVLREDFFETNLDLRKHPEQVFWINFSFFKY